MSPTEVATASKPSPTAVLRLAVALGVATVILYALPLPSRNPLLRVLKDCLYLAAFVVPLRPLWRVRSETEGGESVSWALLFLATLMGLMGHVAWMFERLALGLASEASIGIAQGGYMAWIMLMGIALTLEVSSGGRQGMRAELVVDLLLVGTIGFILATEIFRVLPLVPGSVRPEDMVVGGANLIASMALAVAALGILMSPRAMGGGVPRLMVVFGAFAAAVARVVFAYELAFGALNRWLEPVWIFSLLVIAAAAAVRADEGTDELLPRPIADRWSPMRTLIVPVIIAYALALLVREILGGGVTTGQEGLTWGLLALLIVGRVATALLGSERQAQEVVAWEQRYATVVKALGEVVYEWDPQTNRVLRSGNIKKVFGRDLDDLAPSAHQALDLMHPDDRQPTARAFREAARKGGWFEIEYRIRYADGDWKRICDRGFCIKDDRGETVRVLGVMRDITEAREAEERLRRAERLAALGGLAAGAAHEINNPLAAIQLAAQMMQEDPRLPDDVKEDVRVIERQATRAGEVTDRMLVFARRKEGERKIVTVNEMVEEVLKGRRYDLETHGIRLAVELAEGLPPVWVDIGQIERAILNLVINAEHALEERPEGERHLTIRTGRSDGVVAIEIIDDGPGVPLDVLPYIFDPFFTTREVGRGTGLGLSMSYSIVQGHGGDLRVETRPGAGTTFVIQLPEAPEAVIARIQAEAEAEEEARKSGEWVPIKILVVDDEPPVRELVRRYLEGKGCLVDEADSGATGLKLLSHKDYDSIVLDLRMPDLSGEGLYEWIKKNRPELASRVTVITGDYANPDTIATVERMGRPWLQKPFDLRDLLKLVKEAARAVA